MQRAPTACSLAGVLRPRALPCLVSAVHGPWWSAVTAGLCSSRSRASWWGSLGMLLLSPGRCPVPGVLVSPF